MIIHDASWQKLETLPLTPSGNAATQLEATILSLIGRRQTNGRSLDESDFEASSDELVNKVDDVKVRVRLCLMTDQDICGDYTEAEGELDWKIFRFGIWNFFPELENRYWSFVERSLTPPSPRTEKIVLK